MMQVVCRFIFKVAWSLWMWSPLWIRSRRLVIYADFHLFIECLRQSIWLMCSVYIQILFVLGLRCRVSGFTPAPAILTSVYAFFVALDRVIRGLARCRLALNHLFWLWFVWLTLLLRHAGVSHQFRKREFTTHLNLSIRRGALFPLLGFQLTSADEPWIEKNSAPFRPGVC